MSLTVRWKWQRNSFERTKEERDFLQTMARIPSPGGGGGTVHECECVCVVIYVCVCVCGNVRECIRRNQVNQRQYLQEVQLWAKVWEWAVWTSLPTLSASTSTTSHSPRLLTLEVDMWMDMQLEIKV